MTKTSVFWMADSETHVGINGTKRILAGLVLAAAVVSACRQATAGQAPVDLGSAATFAVLAGSAVTSTGTTTITGDLGSGPGTAVDGFPPGTVSGTIHAGDPVAAQAEADLTTAYNDAAGRTLAPITVAGNIGGRQQLLSCPACVPLGSLARVGPAEGILRRSWRVKGKICYTQLR
jgi:hypothetical protein